MSDLATDVDRHLQPCVRIDSFVVPDAAREEFEATMRRNMDFIRTLHGFQGDQVFEKRDGDSPFNIVTLASWESRDALERAGTEVRAYYRQIGLDMPEALRRWGVELVRADYEARAGLR